MVAIVASQLSPHFGWVDSSDRRQTAASSTRGTLSVVHDGVQIWGSTKFEWTWVELLEWLSDSWLAIIVDDGAPFGEEAKSAKALIAAAEDSVRHASGSLAEEREMELWEFRETHDLSRALAGVASPTLLVWREGFIGHVLTDGDHFQLSWTELQAFLVATGDEISARLAVEGDVDERALLARDAWARREEVETSEVVEQATKMAAEEAASVLAFWRPASAGRNLSELVARSEVLAAARMSADLPDAVVLHLLQEISSASHGEMDQIEMLTRRLSFDSGKFEDLKPYEQGHHAARLTRVALNLVLSDRVDVQAWLADFGVEYREISLGVTGIDAIASWGDSHGPIVIINVDGLHSRSPGGRNVTIAHEIGHLLLDRYAALPAAEVLRGRNSSATEQRAKAFAAELLLPTSQARAAFNSRMSREQILVTVREVAERYGVSQEVVAWQAKNADHPLPRQARKALSTLVSTPWQY